MSDHSSPGSEYPQVTAAFINAIAEEGTKAEAVAYLQKQWNENCALRAELKALRTHAQAAWQQIETAPKDGTVILGYWQGVPGGNTDCSVTKFARGGWCNHNNEEDQWAAPSHWMPVPKGPSLPSTERERK